jgi:[ribosomal protein S5]-alanine N-acetyltransferase
MALRVRLERPTMRRETEYLEAARRSRALHRGLVSTGTTAEDYRQYLRRGRRGNQESFFVILSAENALVGVININDIVRYSLQCGHLGYYAFEPYAGCGLMREGLTLVVNEAFGELGLHRLEASVQPRNERSIALLSGLGFSREGLARRYLKIGGRWLDHERWAILREEWADVRRQRRAPQINHRSRSGGNDA